jgi:hypothetical protein
MTIKEMNRDSYLASVVVILVVAMVCMRWSVRRLIEVI